MRREGGEVTYNFINLLDAAEAGMATGTQVSIPDSIIAELPAFLELNPFVRMPNTPKPDDTIVISSVKIVATMTIKNASDAEPGNGMPEFTIDDIRQEEA